MCGVFFAAFFAVCFAFGADLWATAFFGAWTREMHNVIFDFRFGFVWVSCGGIYCGVGVDFRCCGYCSVDCCYKGGSWANGGPFRGERGEEDGVQYSKVTHMGCSWGGIRELNIHCCRMHICALRRGWFVGTWGRLQWNRSGCGKKRGPVTKSWLFTSICGHDNAIGCLLVVIGGFRRISNFARIVWGHIGAVVEVSAGAGGGGKKLPQHCFSWLQSTILKWSWRFAPMLSWRGPRRVMGNGVATRFCCLLMHLFWFVSHYFFFWIASRSHFISPNQSYW